MTDIICLTPCTLLLVVALFLILPLRLLRQVNTTPTPQSYPVIGNLVGLLRNYHRFYDWAVDLAADAGGLTFKVNALVGFSHILFTVNPLNIQHLLKSNFHNYVKGSRFRTNLHDLLGDGIFNVDGHLWSVQRKIASHEFNTRSLKSFISHTVHREIHRRLLPFLSDLCSKDQILDLQDVLHKFVFDNICNLAFDFDPACLDDMSSTATARASSFFECFDDATEICMSRMISPFPAIWKIKKLFRIGSEKRLREAIRTIDRFAFEIICSKEEKLKTAAAEEKELDLLSRFMLSNIDLDFSKPEEKRKFFRDIIVSFVLAGKDTTSSALTWFFWLLSGHPHCESRIFKEIATAMDRSCEARDLNYDELKCFNYLHAALSESMRLFPPVPINSRSVVNDDILPDGTKIRSGWSADFSTYAIGRMEKVWGSDCREFRPERWLDGDGNFKQAEQYKYPVFHGGPRICLGKDMAYIQMKAVVVAVLHHFRVVVVDGGATPEKMRNPPYKFGMILKMRGGLPVKLIRRN